MKRGRLAVVILVLLGTSRLVAQEVTYNFDQDTDFSKFKSYKWVSIENAQQVDEITARQLTVAIDQEFAKKGLLKTDSDNADLYVGYPTAIGSETQWNAYNTGWGYGPRWGYRDIGENLFRATGLGYVRPRGQEAGVAR